MSFFQKLQFSLWYFLAASFRLLMAAGQHDPSNSETSTSNPASPIHKYCQHYMWSDTQTSGLAQVYRTCNMTWATGLSSALFSATLAVRRSVLWTKGILRNHPTMLSVNKVQYTQSQTAPCTQFSTAYNTCSRQTLPSQI